MVSNYLLKDVGIVSSVENCPPVKELAAMLTVQYNKITSPSGRLTTHYKRFEFLNLRVLYYMQPMAPPGVNWPSPHCFVGIGAWKANWKC